VFTQKLTKRELTWGYFTTLFVSLGLAGAGLGIATTVPHESGSFVSDFSTAALISGVGGTILHALALLPKLGSQLEFSKGVDVGATLDTTSGKRESWATTLKAHDSGEVEHRQYNIENLKNIAWIPKVDSWSKPNIPELTLKIKTPQGTAAVTAPKTQPPPASTSPASPPEQSIQSSKAGASGASMKAGPKPVVAVFDIQDTRKKQGLSVQEKADLTAYLINLLTNTKSYASVPKADLKAALSSQKSKSYEACYDESCQIEIGKEVAAEKSLATRISKLGKKCIVAMTMYDLRKSATENAVQDRVPCDVDSLLEAFEKLVPQLAKN